jgi:hypothetical protein
MPLIEARRWSTFNSVQVRVTARTCTLHYFGGPHATLHTIRASLVQFLFTILNHCDDVMEIPTLWNHPHGASLNGHPRRSGGLPASRTVRSSVDVVKRAKDASDERDIGDTVRCAA